MRRRTSDGTPNGSVADDGLSGGRGELHPGVLSSLRSKAGDLEDEPRGDRGVEEISDLLEQLQRTQDRVGEHHATSCASPRWSASHC